ncbi:MAG TPA: hypothetical protein EYQ14_26165 [Gammaproteobacteria bacterium]|nr:hypothetical protein [Gammaproteobacteria bacterium]HIL99252.1 hypothetical protein [Pseudomonadales bacterium]
MASALELVDEEYNEATPGLGHVGFLVWLDRTGLPAWQIGITAFICLVIFGISNIVISAYPRPGIYSIVIGFVAIISYYLVFYLQMGRGWHRDLQSVLDFDPKLLKVIPILRPSNAIVWVEIVIAFIAACTNIYISGQITHQYPLVYATALILYWFQYLLIILIIDILVRQWIMLLKICDNIRLDLLQTDFYSNLANVMFRFLKLYIFGLSVIILSYTMITAGAVSFPELLIMMTPFYVPALSLGLYLVPYNRFKTRMRQAKAIELNHVLRAINGDRAHLSYSLVGEDAERLTKVDLMYYEDRIRKIKEWPFTDRIRSLLLFGVLPPLTWVIAALIEIFIEGVL